MLFCDVRGHFGHFISFTSTDMLIVYLSVSTTVGEERYVGKIVWLVCSAFGMCVDGRYEGLLKDFLCPNAWVSCSCTAGMSVMGGVVLRFHQTLFPLDHSLCQLCLEDYFFGVFNTDFLSSRLRHFGCNQNHG